MLCWPHSYYQRGIVLLACACCLTVYPHHPFIDLIRWNRWAPRSVPNSHRGTVTATKSYSNSEGVFNRQETDLAAEIISNSCTQSPTWNTHRLPKNKNQNPRLAYMCVFRSVGLSWYSMTCIKTKIRSEWYVFMRQPSRGNTSVVSHAFPASTFKYKNSSSKVFVSQRQPESCPDMRQGTIPNKAPFRTFQLRRYFFSLCWIYQKIGLENRVEDMSSLDKMRWQTKPIEHRSLYIPTRWCNFFVDGCVCCVRGT